MRKISGLNVSRLASAGIMVGLGATFVSSASAQTLTTFAQATRNALTPVGSIVFDKNTGVLGVSGGAAGVPLSFTYQVPNGYGPSFTPINSIFRFTANVNGPATLTPGTGGFTNFDVNFTNIQFTFTATTPGPNGATNLLSGNFGSGTLSGQVGSGAATFTSAITQNPVTTGVVGYASDFLDFNNTATTKFASEQFALALSAVNATGNVAGPTFDASNNLNSFSSDPTGTFSSNPVPPSLTPTPAPPGVVSGLIGIAMGGAQFGMMKFRGRRRAKKTEATEVAA